MNPTSDELKLRPASPALAVVIVLGLFLIVTSAFYPISFLTLFDAKRIIQLGIFAALILFAIAWSPLRKATIAQLSRIRRFDLIMLAAFFTIGLVSSLRLQHPSYALLDVSMLFVMLLLIFVTAASRELSGQQFDRWALVLLAVLGFAVFVQESMGILVGWVTGREFSYKQALVHFAHPRFYNHLQTWSIPLLAALPLLFPDRRGIKVICVLLLGLQWFLVILTAARGTTVGLLTAMVVIAFLMPEHRRYWLKMQLAGFFTAVLLYASILFLNSMLIPQSGDFFANSVGRPMMNTSGRSSLWQLSINDGLSNPLLGAGPTRYACDYHRFLPAHPHSFPFKILGEWGVIAFFLMILLAGRAGFVYFKSLKSISATGQTGPPLQAILATSLIAGVIHAGLSGVLTMPASQVAMILIVGWLFGVYRSSSEAQVKPVSSRLLLSTGVLLASAQLTFAIQEIPQLHERTAYAEAYGPMVPRIWQEGRVCKYSYSDTSTAEPE